jgi:excisionase family DNA binding protein
MEAGKNKLMTPKAAAEHLGVSPSLVYQWIEEQRLAHYRFGGEGRRGRILIAPADLDKLMQHCRVERHPLLEEAE